MAKYLRDRFKTFYYGILFCDMDQVLSDFYTGAERVLGRPFHSYDKDKASKRERDEILGKHETFWENLPPMPDYRKLWDYIAPFEPHLLTAVPHWEDENCEIGKRKWVNKHLGIPQDRVHVVRRVEKQLYATHSGKQNVLIDDNNDNIREFSNAGGIAVLHTDAHSTILKLKSLGFLRT